MIEVIFFKINETHKLKLILFFKIAEEGIEPSSLGHEPKKLPFTLFYKD